MPSFRTIAIALLACLHAHAQSSAIERAWDDLVGPGAPANPAARSPRPADDFADHFFFEGRADYWRYSTSFTGLPTTSSVINAPFTGIFDPAGIPYAAIFQPVANRVEGLIDWGTRGYLSDRVNTHFMFRYAQDVSTVVPGAPAQNLIETFGGHRELQLLQGSVEILAGRGITVDIGRHDFYDGGQVTVNRKNYEVSVYGGRRFTFFSNPDQRAIGGAKLLLRLNPDTSIEAESLWYVRGDHRLALRRRLGPRWQAKVDLRAVGGSPVDFNVLALYGSPASRTSLRTAFYQKLTNRDYFYDFTDLARNTSARLYLGPQSPYSQFSVDLQQMLSRRLRAGGAVWVRRLNDSTDQGPFDTSFEDYRANAQLYPGGKVSVDLDYHQRNSDRLNPLTATTFDDMHAVGETSVKDATLGVRRSFLEGRFELSGGGYYRRISMQDRFLVIHGAHQSGWLAGGSVRVDRHTRLYADYSLDNDFFVFKPDIANSRALRTGVAWRY